jgi:photosystem II stability/assembly factor-like uncharacterized protein
MVALADAAARGEAAPSGIAAVGRVRQIGRTRSALPVGALALAAILVVATVAIVPRLGGQPAIAPSRVASHSAIASATGSATASPTTALETASPSPTESPTASLVPDAERFSPAAIAFFDARHGLLGGDSAGQGVIWRTDDGGVTFQKQLVPAPGILAIAVAGSSEAWAAAICRDFDPPIDCPSVLLHSSDAGRTWQKISEIDLSSVSFVNSHRGWAIQSSYPGPATATGPLLSTSDGGRTWTPVAADPCSGADTDPRSVFFTDALHGWVGCSRPAGVSQGPKAISVTSDGGRTWRVVAASVPPDGPWIGGITVSGYLDGLVMRPSGTGLYWADLDDIQKTTDGGRTWTPVGLADGELVEVTSAWLIDDRDWLVLVQDGTVASGTPQLLEATSDGGRTWHIVSRIPLPPS